MSPIPSSMTSGGVILRRAGYRVTAVPSDPTFWTEIQCSSSTAFASSRSQIRKLAPSAGNRVLATFELPFSTRTYFSRARHFKVGYTTGPWSTVASAQPYYLVDQMPDPGYYAHHVSQFGTLTAARQKTIRITNTEMVPYHTSEAWLMHYSYSRPTNINIKLSLTGAMTMPQGVTITKIASRVLRSGAGSTVTVVLKRLNSTGGVVNLVTLTATTNIAYQTLNSSALTELVTSTRSYGIAVDVKTTQATLLSTKGGEYLFSDITYTVPHLGAAY